MNWTSLVGPAVVAAVISGLVSGIGIWISARTARRIHTEKLAFDREQAERRTAAKIKLAETKLTFDRVFAAWKRRSELAEEVLADFYRARRIIQEARSPGSFGDEGKSRPKLEGETEEEGNTLDAYYAAAERLRNRSEVFARLHAHRYRFMATFGSEAVIPFDQLDGIYAEIIVAVKMLLMTHRHRDMGFTPQGIQQWKTTIGWAPEADPIPVRLDRIVATIEQICRPVIQDVPQ